jgi:hypothetical protein
MYIRIKSNAWLLAKRTPSRLSWAASTVWPRLSPSALDAEVLQSASGPTKSALARFAVHGNFAPHSKDDASHSDEMSAHHYVRDFLYCDSGLIPMLLILVHPPRTGRTLGEEVAEMRCEHPSPGAFNLRVADLAHFMTDICARYPDRAVTVDELDGLGLEFPDWHVNLRR